VTRQEVAALARFLAGVGPGSVSVVGGKARRDSGARYCGCGRRISANRGACLECAIVGQAFTEAGIRAGMRMQVERRAEEASVGKSLDAARTSACATSEADAKK